MCVFLWRNCHPQEQLKRPLEPEALPALGTPCAKMQRCAEVKVNDLDGESV